VAEAHSETYVAVRSCISVRHDLGSEVADPNESIALDTVPDIAAACAKVELLSLYTGCFHNFFRKFYFRHFYILFNLFVETIIAVKSKKYQLIQMIKHLHE
jgi:hypothetical protein